MFSNSSLNRGMLVFSVLVLALISAGLVSGSTPALDVKLIEYISEVVAYDQTLGEENVTFESPGELGENRTGKSRTNVTLYDIRIHGILNISNLENVGNTTLVSVNVTLNGTENISAIELLSGPNYLVYNISTGETPDKSSNISIFITELRGNDSAIFNFSVEGTGDVGEPLNLTEEYSSWRVMTGQSVNVTLNATNSMNENVTIYDLQLTKTPEQYDRIGSGYVYFNYTDLEGEDSTSASISVDGLGRSILTWDVSGGNLSQTETRQIKFKSWAPENISQDWEDAEDLATWMSMGNISASFKMNGSVTGLRIFDAEASALDASFTISKERYNETHWNGTLNISNEAKSPLDYNVTYVSIWATKYQTFEDPGDIDNWVNETNVTAFDFADILGTYANATWTPGFNLSGGSFNDSYSILFNYSLVPIIWSDASFMILKDTTQVAKYNMSEAEEYLFIEEIYVLLGGYLVKVTKTVTPYPISDVNNSYSINITLENIGQERTPDLVTMFDLIPGDFHPLVFETNGFSINRSMTENNVLNVTDIDGDWVHLGDNPATVLGYADTSAISSGAYANFWGYHIDFAALNATSNGDGRYDSSNPRKEVGVAYKFAGNGTLASIENAYIVGVDPIRLEGGLPSRSVASGLRISSSTREYAVIIVSLLVSVVILSSGFGLMKRK